MRSFPLCLLPLYTFAVQHAGLTKGVPLPGDQGRVTSLCARRRVSLAAALCHCYSISDSDTACGARRRHRPRRPAGVDAEERKRGEHPGTEHARLLLLRVWVSLREQRSSLSSRAALRSNSALLTLVRHQDRRRDLLSRAVHQREESCGERRSARSCLRACCKMSGTDLHCILLPGGYTPTPPEAMRSVPVRLATSLRAHYAMSGTDVPYDPTSAYVMSSTERIIPRVPTRSPVLR